MEQANALRSRLSAREQYLLDANLAIFGPVEPQLQRWRQMIQTYPDSHAAQFGLAQQGMFYANEYAGGLAPAKAASVPQYERRAHAVYLQGMLNLGLERYADAERAFKDADAGNPKFRTRMYDQIYPAAVKRDWARVDSMMALRKGSGVASDDLSLPYHRMLFAIDRGDWSAAAEAAQAASMQARKVEPLIAGRGAMLRADALDAIGERASKAELESRLQSRLADIREHRSELQAAFPNYDDLLALQVGYIAARIGSRPMLERVLAQVDAAKIVGYPLMTDMREVLLAESDRLAGKPGQAVARLKALSTGADASFPVHVALLRAARAADDEGTARQQADWVATHRGRAYVEMGLDYLTSMLNVADSTLALLDQAELSQEEGASDAVARSRRAFDAAWPRKGWTPSIARRVDALDRASDKAKGAGSR